jgi:iron complex outermembrane receptor protein
VNATIFQTNYEDIQLRQQTQVGGILTTLIENAAEARIRGVEVELTAAPLQGLMLSAAYGHLSARYLDVGKVPNITLDSRLQRIPSHSFTASADYRASIGPGQIELHADFSYRSKEQFQIIASPFDQQGYGLVGARATYRSLDERWSLALFGINLTDERYRAAARGAVTIIGMPRQVGIELAHRF